MNRQVEQLRNWGAVIFIGLLSPLLAHAASSTGVSPIFAVDNRSLQTGSIAGRVLGAGAPLANAQVRVLDTPYTTKSGAGGSFSITGIPSGVGYVLAVTASGYAVQRFPNINISAGPNNVGNLALGNLIQLPVQLRPLVPDVNPKVTEVEHGGTAYRYYQLSATDGLTLVGGVVGLRRAGGAVVPQDGDISHEWAGYEIGKPDGDGLVRLRLPSSAIGNTGSTAIFEVLLGATAVQTFTATVKEREYDQVWKQKAEGEASASKGFLRLGLNGSVASELRHEIRGGQVAKEVVGWKTETQLELGYGRKTHDKGLGIFKGSGGLGFYIGYDYSSEYSFPPDTTDGELNLEKVYVAYAPFLKFSSTAISLLPGETAYEKLVNRYSTLVAPRRTQTAWNGHVGGTGNVKGGGHVPLNGLRNTEVSVDAKLEGEIGGFAGIENVYGIDEQEAGQGVVFGFEVDTAVGVKALMQNIKFNSSDVHGFNFNREFGFRATVKGRVWTPQTSINPTRVDLEISRETEYSVDFNVMGWKGLEGGLSKGEKVETTETLSFILPYPQYYNQFAANGEVWGLMRNYEVTWLKAHSGAVSELFGGLIGNPYQSSQIVCYKREAYRTLTHEVALADDVKFLRRAFGLDLKAQFERGAKGKLESGVLWHTKRLALESYPSVTGADFPVDGYWRKQEEWMRRGFPQFNAVVQRVEHFVNDVQGGITVVRDGVQSAYLQVNDGVQQSGQWISSTVSGLFSDQNVPPRKSLKQSLGGFPLEPAPNQVYAISGLVRFESTNTFVGSAALTLHYTSTDVVGLSEVDLRIYRLGDGSNHWELVGGTVDMLAHSMRATITNLGTFAIAPPLPTGELVLSVASNTMLADGLATSLITVSNLMLNNGQAATQPWLFTVAASGVEILDSDVTGNYSGVQRVSTNGVLRFTVRAPLGGHTAKVAVASVAGDATGELGINLIDNVPPVAPSKVQATAGQSRVRVSWQTNSEPDITGYRVYYRAGTVGPPWDGTAAVEGVGSPISVTGTNSLLRGLALGTDYFVSVSAVDTTGNESALTRAIKVTTTPQTPNPPSGVAVRFGEDAKNVLMWTLSEDDGYNDRDVIRYDVWRVVKPGENWLKVGEVAAGSGLFTEANIVIGAGQHVRYAVAAVDKLGATSARFLANRFVAGTASVDNDGDGMADDWELANGLNPTNPADANDDLDLDGLTNLQEFLAGKSPGVFDNLQILHARRLSGGDFELSVFGEPGKSYALEASTNLVKWDAIRAFTCTSSPTVVVDTTAKIHGQRFYRVASLSAAGPIRVGFKAATGTENNGIELQLDAPLGLNYRIERSTNLVDWSTVGVLPGTNSPLSLRDTSATNFPARFYRGVVQ